MIPLAGALWPVASAHAEDPVVSAEAQAAASQAASGVSADTYDAENLVYFLLYGGANVPSAGRVIQHRTGGTVSADEDVSGRASWVAGLGIALIPPRFEWFACETHVELGVTTLDAQLLEGCAGCTPAGEAEPSMFTLQAGITFRATVPLRFLSLDLGAGPILTTFIHDFSDRSPTPDQPATFEQWDGALGLRLVAGVHFLLSADARLFIDYRHDRYLDAIGQPPTSAPPGPSTVRRDEVDGLTIHSIAGGLEFNVPDYQQSSARGKTTVVAVPILAALVVGAIALVPVLSEE